MRKSTIWGYFMLLVYFGMGYLLIFSDFFSSRYAFSIRIALGIAFFAYGLFRVYRIISKKKHDEQDDNE